MGQFKESRTNTSRTTGEEGTTSLQNESEKYGIEKKNFQKFIWRRVKMLLLK